MDSVFFFDETNDWEEGRRDGRMWIGVVVLYEGRICVEMKWNLLLIILSSVGNIKNHRIDRN